METLTEEEIRIQSGAYRDVVYVVAVSGAKGRGLTDGHGRYTGMAPSCIVDLKTAERYLCRRLEDLPKDTEKIIMNDTSTRVVLSLFTGTTGNSFDYELCLKALGTANERDNIFVVSCYY